MINVGDKYIAQSSFQSNGTFIITIKHTSPFIVEYFSHYGRSNITTFKNINEVKRNNFKTFRKVTKLDVLFYE